MRLHQNNILCSVRRRITTAPALLAVLTFFAVLPVAMSSCSDEPTEDNYYTFTGEMVSDYLTSRPETFSEFTEILQRSGLFGMMAPYGTYTCLAPTNDAINKYLQQRGKSSVAELTQEDCDTIS